MCATPKTKHLSPFAQSTLKLDQDFALLDHLGQEIERLSIDSFGGLDRSKQLLLKFGELGEQITVGIQDLAKNLNEMRDRAEKIAQAVAERATQVQERHVENNRMVERYRALGEVVGQTTGAMAALTGLATAATTAKEKSIVAKQLSEFDSQLRLLVVQIQKLQEEARHLKMKALERSAGSLWQGLDAARKKLSGSLQGISSGVHSVN